MLNTFPALLTYGFFAPTLLRVAVALALFYIAYAHYKNRGEISRERFPVIGANGWVAWFSIAVEVVVALMLLAGYHTQIAAIIGALIGFKHLIWAHKFPAYFVLSRTAAFFFLVICLSLLVSGAGALAIDVPL